MMTKTSFVDSILAWLSTDPGKAVIAGGLGGVVRWLTLRHSLAEGIVTIVIGGICAMFLGPLTTPILEPTIGKIAPVGNAAGLGAFIVGMAGVSLSGLIMDIFERKRRGANDVDKD
jgi:hypothetical protein